MAYVPQMTAEERKQMASAAYTMWLARGGIGDPVAGTVEMANQLYNARELGVPMQNLHSLPSGSRLQPLAASRDKFKAEAANDKTGIRSGTKPLQSWARESLVVDGFDRRDIDNASPMDIAKAGMGFASETSLRNDATMTTSSLSEITRDAINKSLAQGYSESPQTWRGPMRQGASAKDFKDISRVRLGSAPNLPVWPDNMPPEQARLSNERVSYAVEARAETVSISWQLFVNDDLDALTRTPWLLGDAAARTVNATAWSQITSNPTMPYDSVALFSAATGARKRANLITGSASPTSATIGQMKALMRLMRGLNTPEGNEGSDILNLVPRYLVVPSALETTAAVLVTSSADPAASGNSGVYNPNSNLLLVVEPLLDVASSTAFYVFADPKRIDTVEVTFLQGQEEPVTNFWVDNATMSRNYTVIQTFGARAIDHRGIVKHAGA